MLTTRELEGTSRCKKQACNVKLYPHFFKHNPAGQPTRNDSPLETIPAAQLPRKKETREHRNLL